jgi:hypothetical protein
MMERHGKIGQGDKQISKAANGAHNKKESRIGEKRRKKSCDAGAEKRQQEEKSLSAYWQTLHMAPKKEKRFFNKALLFQKS